MNADVVMSLGQAAFAVSIMTVAGSVLADRYVGTGSQVLDVVGGFLGLVLWGAFALGSTNMEYFSRCCVRTESEPVLTFLGLVGGGGMLLIAISGTTKLVDVRDIYPATADRTRPDGGERRR